MPQRIKKAAKALRSRVGGGKNQEASHHALTVQSIIRQYLRAIAREEAHSFTASENTGIFSKNGIDQTYGRSLPAVNESAG